MAVRYYDDAIIYKIKKWLPDNTKLRILRPDDVKQFFAAIADDRNDQKLTLPLIALTRNKDIELLSNIKQNKSFSGLKLLADADKTLQFNVIPIKLAYQLDIYTKTYEEGDEYVRNFIFKLVNNPAIIITIPYQGSELQHIANIRVLETISDTSDITEHIYQGQFTRWTIQFEIQDAFLFSLPYRQNWRFSEVELEVADKILDPDFSEISTIYP